MIPTLTKPGLAELPPKSAYDKLAFIESHYDELCEMYQTIMEHLKLPQVEAPSGGSGEGIKWVTHKVDLPYVDIIFSENTLLDNFGYSSVEEAIKLLPYRSGLEWGEKDFSSGNARMYALSQYRQNNSIKAVYMGTTEDGKHKFRFPREYQTGFEYGESFTLFIKSKFAYPEYIGWANAVLVIKPFIRPTYECSNGSETGTLKLDYISSDSSGSYYTFTEKYIDDSEVE